MQSRTLEVFYLLFQGVLVFQVLVFGGLYFFTGKKDLLYYSLFLFFAAAYFFINAPYTFFGIPEDTVWNSAWYDFANTPVIVIENLFYLLFLQSFFTDITRDIIVKRVLRFTLWMIPFILLLFVLLTVLQMDKQFIFYTVKLMSVIPAVIVAYIVLTRRPPFAILVANGLLCTIAGTCITVFMIILRNKGVHHLFTDGYPLFFIRLGILGDMIFYLAAILKKWHFQEKQLIVEKLESQLAVEKMRNKISSELHDDFGSTLSGINMYTYMVNDLLQSGKYEQVKQSVDIIQKSADEMSHYLSDLVWAINPEQDGLQKLIERLEEYATTMGNAKHMQTRVNVPANTDKLIIPVETRRNIYLFCKEAINNAVKYSNATVLDLDIKLNNDLLEILIADNGSGFDIEKIKKGNGLVNMQKRADEIGAKLVFQSKINEGALVSLEYKFTQ
jgi:signal transduction histidine kinase